jgi:hypothetical protein
MKLSIVKKSAAIGLLWACASIGQAGVVNHSLSDYTSSVAAWDSYPLSDNVGTFSFGNIGKIISATISGTFGNGYSNTTTEAFVYGDGVEVAYCSLWDDCSTNGETAPPTAWSYTFSADQLALFTDGFLDINISKEWIGQVNLGSLNLELNVANNVPEPGTTTLLLAGLAGMVWAQRRRQRKS